MWKFIKSSSGQENILRHEAIEVCFIGRSNVGKSTLINSLANSKIAKVSKTPGRTRLINYFQTDKNIIVVDLPGYGFAKLSKGEQEKMFTMVDEYFLNNKPKVVFLLIDAKIGIQEQDKNIINHLDNLNHNIVLVLTKCDKPNQSELHKTLSNEIFKKYQYFKSSSNNKKQLSLLLDYIYSFENKTNI